MGRCKQSAIFITYTSKIFNINVYLKNDYIQLFFSDEDFIKNAHNVESFP